MQTAPDHFLGDYPAIKWRDSPHALPADLRGTSVLDIGCNGGFYSIEMKRRGAERVVGIDSDDDYLAQARFAAEVCGLEIEFRQLSVYDVAQLGERFDVVLFMGVLYHLRHPLLALDLIHEHVAATCSCSSRCSAAATRCCRLARRTIRSRSATSSTSPAFPKLHFVEHSYAGDPTNWWIPNRACVGSHAAQRRASDIAERPGGGGLRLPRGEASAVDRSYSGGAAVIEAVMLWNEPNNKSHWDFEIDPGWERYAQMVKLAADGDRGRESGACRACWAAFRRSTRTSSATWRDSGVLAPHRRGRRARVSARLEPLDDRRVAGQARRDPRGHAICRCGCPKSASRRSAQRRCRNSASRARAELLIGRRERIHWYSLYDLPRAWPATTRHREAEGSSYYRHFYMGLLREDGTPEARRAAISRSTRPSSASASGSTSRITGWTTRCAGCGELGVKHLRTGLSWADSLRPDAERWFDRQMRALRDFDVTRDVLLHARRHAAFAPHHTSPPSTPKSLPNSARA